MVHVKIVDVLIRYFVLIGASWVEGVWGIALIAPIGAKGGGASVCDNPRGKAKPPHGKLKRGQRDAALGVYKLFGMKYL